MTYEPGTVAEVTYLEKRCRAMRTGTPKHMGWEVVRGDGTKTWCSDTSCCVTDVRPLVVLDLVNAEQTIKTLRIKANDCGIYQAGVLSELADQIKAQTKPPRIPEPNECGATVIASQVGEIEGSDRLWVRFRHGKSDCWIDQYELIRSWSDLDSPRQQACEGES